MKQNLQSYLRAHRLQLFVAALIGVGLAFGLFDPGMALACGIVLDTAPGTMRELYGAMEKSFEAVKDANHELQSRVLDLEQKRAHRPSFGGGGGGDDGGLASLIVESPNLKSFLAGQSPSTSIAIPERMLHKALIVGSSVLVVPDRQATIVAPPGVRLFLRDLFPNVPVSGNTVEVTKELAFTNSAAPQGATLSPDTGPEGQLKAESALSFELATVPVVTVAHWIPASRQVLSDLPQLQNFVEARLLYGLSLKVEQMMLSGIGLQGEFQGLIANSTAYSGGSTNQTALDAISMAVGQLVAAGYEPSAIIVSPRDWYSTALTLAKDGQSRYQFGNPGELTAPSLWGIRVLISSNMTSGTFLVLDANRAGFVGVREDAIVRVSENTDDDFVKNKVRILVETRLAFCITQVGAVISGSLSHAG